MLKRIYVNNYRCLVNFELTLDRLTLLMGPNGGGKSTLFDVLYGIRRLIADNARLTEVFPPDDLTAWVSSTEQSFELGLEGNEGLFSYKLVISHTADLRKQKIHQECLTHDGKPIFEFLDGQVQLYHDDYTIGPPYSYDWSMSALAGVAARHDNKKLTWFKEWVRKLFILSLQPKAMASETEDETDWLNRDGTNFSSWYRYISQEHQDKILPLAEELRKVIPGFYAFKLEAAGKRKILKVGISNDADLHKTVFFDFDRVSDGQRVLIVLYCLLTGMRDLGHTVFLDEPENYLALQEIQPWLMKLNDACGEGFPQTVLISHHPELVDYLGAEWGRWLEREPLGQTRVKGMPETTEPGLKLSEIVARGWTS